MSARPQRIPGTIAQEIGADIVCGRLKPGALLADEVTASERRHVSRSAYREAIRTLAAKGLVQSRPKLGTRVSPVSSWHLLDPDVLAWMFSTEPPRALLADLFALRRTIEPQIAALAAARRTARQAAELAQALEVMAERTLRTQEGRDADKAFHAKLIEACGNPFLASLSDSIAAAVIWSTIFKYRIAGARRDPVPSHRKVYEAVAAGDAAAARTAMEELIDIALADTDELLAAPRRKKPSAARARRD